MQNAAIGIDARSGRALEELEVVLDRLKAEGHTFEILFLDADDKVLVKRYKESRRSHPLAMTGRVDDGIRLERKKIRISLQQQGRLYYRYNTSADQRTEEGTG